jgi:DNA-binding NarL/FixJ family response regulator
MTTSVAIVDDQAMVRAGFRSLVEGEPDLEVVGEAADGEAAISLLRRTCPAVALMDVRMPGMDGIQATRRLVESGCATRILVLTTFDVDAYVFAALRAGASGFLLKDAPAEDLIDAIRVLARGEALIAPAVTRRVIEEFARLPAPDPSLPGVLEQLTAREAEVLRLLARGLSNAEIARELVVSDATVKTHVARVLMKLDLRDRVQAVVFAYESGLVRPGT